LTSSLARINRAVLQLAARNPQWTLENPETVK